MPTRSSEYLIFIVIILLFFGCAKTQPINVKQLPEIKKIGVISVLGSQVEYQYLETTVFNKKQVPICSSS